MNSLTNSSNASFSGAELFLSEIMIHSSRNISNFVIPLSFEKKKHLIVTGKNGSGKTGFLLDLDAQLSKFQKKQWPFGSKAVKNQKAEGVSISFSKEELIRSVRGSAFFQIAFFPANRSLTFSPVVGINKIQSKSNYGTRESASKNFLQFLVNLKAEKSFAKEEGKHERVKEIDSWFKNFVSRLQSLFSSPNLFLDFDTKEFIFRIIEPNKKPYHFNELPDGYAAVLSIMAELFLRISQTDLGNTSFGGIVLIDEIETHLHVDLQKEILPFLIDLFPNIQFIVSTHSPFVLSSVSNAIICDLEKRIVFEDFSPFSYEAIVESYFDTDQYSTTVKEKIWEYKNLSAKKKSELSSEEKLQLTRLVEYFDKLPIQLMPELETQLRLIKNSLLSIEKAQ
ncbi:MAG: hypothetical protein ACD_39C02122G0004 [uncultured bacterium]|nr:MAG: hypothetical protein ACD_39C02122G0004 [uncultured bacterium]